MKECKTVVVGGSEGFPSIRAAREDAIDTTMRIGSSFGAGEITQTDETYGWTGQFACHGVCFGEPEKNYGICIISKLKEKNVEYKGEASCLHEQNKK